MITFDPDVIQFRAYRPDVSAFSYPEATHGFNSGFYAQQKTTKKKKKKPAGGDDMGPSMD